MGHFRNSIEKLVGLYSVKASNTDSGHLKLLFSRNRGQINRLENNGLIDEWVFETISSAWRLTMNNCFLAGSFEEGHYNDKELNCLIGLNLISAVFDRKTDLTLHFENGYKLETFNQANTFPALQLYSNSNYSLATHSFLLETVPREMENADIMNRDKMENGYVEKCCNRWAAKLPSETPDNNCQDCAFFLPMSGSFFFGNFGLCSNEQSLFDAKVVGLKSGCEHFDKEKNNEN